MLGVDLNAAVIDKLRSNAKKYPVPTFRGTICSLSDKAELAA